MHRKFLIFGRMFCALGAVSGIVLLIIYLFNITVTFPGILAYAMLLSMLIAVLCLLIGFALDLMSHFIRKDMSAIMWLFVFMVVITVVQIVYGQVGGQQVDYIQAFYNGVLIAAGIRGLWYIIGIRPYEINLEFKDKK